MSDTRVFVCDVEPLGSGGWEVWISELPYRGVRTDAVCGEIGERRKRGGAYTSRWFVGRRPLAITARMLAERSVKQADKLAVRTDAEATRDAFKVTTAALTTAPPEPAPGPQESP